jgi:hypothetical protein
VPIPLVTVAANVTESPYVDVLRGDDEVTVVVVAGLLTVTVLLQLLLL